MAFISEIKYAGLGEAASDEFVEVTIGPNDDPADFTLSFYDADGTLHASPSSFFAAGEFTLQDIIDITGDPGSSPSGVGGLDLQVITHPDNPDWTIFIIPSDLAKGTTSVSAEAVALTDTSGGTVVDAYDIGSGSNSVTFTQGAAVGATPTPTVNGASILIDIDGNVSVGTPGSGTSSICLAGGTLVRTQRGQVPVEKLQPKDLVCVAGGGFRPLRYSYASEASVDQMQVSEKLRPVRIEAGALGRGLPLRDLFVSRQHRMIVHSAIAQRMFGTPEVFVAAHRLTTLPQIEIVMPKQKIAYYHLLFDRHEVIEAEGVPTESLLLGEQACEVFGPQRMIGILERSPLIADSHSVGGSARPIPKPAQQRNLIRRHEKNGVPLLVKSARRIAA